MARPKKVAQKVKREHNWREKTLNQLEKINIPRPEQQTSLIERAANLYSVQLKNFTIENLRLAIGQNIGMKYTVPLALEILENDILAEGNMYDGDLLNNLLNTKSDYFTTDKECLLQLLQIYERNEEKLNTFDTTNSIKKDWKKGFENLKAVYENHFQ